MRDSAESSGTATTRGGLSRRALLGGAVLAAACRAAESSASAHRGVRCVTWNIRHGRGLDGQVDLARVAATLAALEVDVALLQEVDRGCARSGGVDQARELGERLGLASTFGAHRPFDGGEYGLAVLARGRITGATAHPLAAAPRPLVALEASLERDAGACVRAYSVHLVDTLEERTAEARELRALAAARRGAGAALVGGDFNGPRGTAPLLAFAPWPVADPGGLTFPAGEPVREIDFLVASEGAWHMVAVVPEAAASDHRPVLGVWRASEGRNPAES